MTRIVNDLPAAIDFDSELSRGLPAYEDKLGEWWLSRARDPAHSRAYRRIAEFLRVSLKRPPRLVVDYACGSGELLERLGASFPEARLVGLDGSAYLLGVARRRLAQRRDDAGRRTTLIQTPLPRFDLPAVKADLTLFVFPNLLPTPTPRECACHKQGRNPAQSALVSSEISIARSLSLAKDARADDHDDNPDTVRAFLLQARLVARNLRGLLKKGALCVRVEYGRARRDELSEIDLLKISFEEGSLDMQIDGSLPPQWFRVLACSYFRSGVIEDVHQQTGKRVGGPGGYLITMLRAI
jgi:SAM-dependent methyltransferase